MLRQLIPILCLCHGFAIFWWTVPYSYGNFISTNFPENLLPNKYLKSFQLENQLQLSSLIQRYIDISGSQQYWDFFAPHSARYHQYLSVCDGIVAVGQEIIGCKSKPLFSNLGDNFKRFETFGSHRSRLYRLTENLAKLEDKDLLAAFAQYYLKQHSGNHDNKAQAVVVMHQFELHPELIDLPKPGYRSDRILLDGGNAIIME